jgi:hypothetical protein
MREMGRVRVGRVVRVSREKFEAWIDAHTESRRDKKRRNVDERQLGLFSSRR